MSPRTPDPGWSDGEMTRHRYLVTATILASPHTAARGNTTQRAAAQQDQQMLRWIHSTGQ